METRRGYWPYTSKQAREKLRSGTVGSNQPDAKSTATELDPDGPARTSTTLAADDLV